MTLQVERELGSLGWFPLENCCMCRMPTPYWYGTGPHNVALCERCADKYKSDDLPTKAEWIASERRLNPRPFWNRV